MGEWLWTLAIVLSLNLKSNFQRDLKLRDIPIHNGAAFIDHLKPVHEYGYAINSASAQ
jgi:hypothetical protein